MVADFFSLSICIDNVEYIISSLLTAFFCKLFSLIPIKSSAFFLLQDFSLISKLSSSFKEDFLVIVSTKRQSFAFLAFTPSSIVQNTSARSLLIFRLSVSLVKPPVPGRTARSGTSGNDILDDPSSTSRI